jgi:AraC family transcriptional regulator
MRALDETTAALGTPILVRELGAPTAVIARWRHRAAVVDVAPSESIRLAMSLVDGPNARTRDSGAPTNPVRGASITVFSPAEGASVEVSGEADVVQLFLDQASVQATLDAPFVCPPMFDLRDDGMRSTIMRMLVDSARSGPDDPLSIEEGLHALALRLERHARQWRTRSETSPALFRGGLAPAAFRRVEAMIEAALDEAASLSLAEMAAAVGLSVTYFARAFRRHTGRTPHNYIVRRRMDRAVSLLRVAKIPIAEVAEAAGFSTPAHFVATFRAAMSVTPGALRDALTG